MRSMTGFGQASGENGRFGFTVTLRTVNHRFLDVKLRLADVFQQAETPLRELLGGELSRGRVEAHVLVSSLEERQARVEVHRNVLRAIHTAVHDLAQEGLIEGELSAGDLLRLPEVFQVETVSESFGSEDQALLLEVAGRALEQLVRSRSTEGESLERALAERLTALGEIAGRFGGLRAEAVGEMRSGLAARIDELLEGRSVEPNRLEQELALLVDRSDVAEEIDRLRSHLEHFEGLLATPGAVGKRLDFLTQEIFRELNTLGSKCRHPPTVRAVLDAKTLCEQLREQVQNVE